MYENNFDLQRTKTHTKWKDRLAKPNTKTVCVQLVGYDNSDIHKNYEYINITSMHVERQNMTTLINSCPY